MLAVLENGERMTVDEVMAEFVSDGEVLESLALNRPVISTAVMGIPELVRSRETGWLVPPANPEALADAMMECLTADPTLLNRMGNAGRKLIAERHDPRIEAASLLSLIQKYAQPKHAP